MTIQKKETKTICVIIISKHKANYNRIGNGSEPKIGEIRNNNV